MAWHQQITSRAGSLLPDVTAVLRRFPLASLAALALMVLLQWAMTQRGGDWYALLRASAWLTGSFLWCTSVTLHAEAHGLGPARRLSTQIAGIVAIGLLMWQAARLDVQPYLLLAALTVLLPLAPFTARPDNGALWHFTHQIGVGIGFGILAAVLLGGGLSAILGTLQYLFGVRIHYEVYSRMWIVAMCLVGPLIWLSTLPDRFDQRSDEGVQREFTSRAIGMVASHVQVPLLLAYTAILYAYAVKIGFDRELPKGRIGWMVLAFGGAGIATMQMLFPTRSVGGALVRFFWRWWFVLLLLPLALLFIAVAERIAQYGLTEGRYVVAGAGLWMLGLVAFYWRRDGDRDLRWVQALAGMLMLIASVGPWGAAGLSARLQVRELLAVLQPAGIVKDGHVDATATAAAKLTDESKARVHAVVNYLRDKNQLRRLVPLFEGHASDPFKGVELSRNDWSMAQKVTEALGAGKSAPSRAPNQPRYVYLGSGNPTVLDAAGVARIVGPISVSFPRGTGKEQPRESKRDIPQDAPQVRITVADGKLTVIDAGSVRSAVFDPLGDAQLVARMKDASPGRKDGAFMLEPSGGDLAARLLVTNLNGTERSGTIEFNSITFWILLK